MDSDCFELVVSTDSVNHSHVLLHERVSVLLLLKASADCGIESTNHSLFALILYVKTIMLIAAWFAVCKPSTVIIRAHYSSNG